MAKQQVRIGSRGQTPSFDWNDPSTWSKALQGMDKVYITYHPDLAVPGALEAIEGLSEAASIPGAIFLQDEVGRLTFRLHLATRVPVPGSAGKRKESGRHERC